MVPPAMTRTDTHEVRTRQVRSSRPTSAASEVWRQAFAVHAAVRRYDMAELLTSALALPDGYSPAVDALRDAAVNVAFAVGRVERSPHPMHYAALKRVFAHYSQCYRDVLMSLPAGMR